MPKLPFLVLALLLVAVAARADTIYGTVQSSSPSALDIVVYDPSGKPYPNVLPVKVNRRHDLDPGDYVKLDVKRSSDGSWQAGSVEKVQAPRSAPPLGTQVRQSNPLWDALTSPRAKKAAKGGLIGAAVGGIAAGTSGGKTGRGALVGAGIGAAASFVEDLLLRPAPTVPYTPPQSAQPYYPQD